MVLRVPRHEPARVCLVGAELDPDEWDFPPKPKWMRWATYNISKTWIILSERRFRIPAYAYAEASALPVGDQDGTAISITSDTLVRKDRSIQAHCFHQIYSPWSALPEPSSSRP